MHAISTLATSGWADFFVVTGGAAAALAGLLFVSVSINLDKIIGLGHLPARAVEALVVLLSALCVAVCGAAPGQADIVVGFEFSAIGLIAVILSTRIQLRAGRHPWRWVAKRVVRNQAPVVPFALAGLGILAGFPSWVVWVVPGMMFSMVAGVMNAWVLLVEIHREER